MKEDYQAPEAWVGLPVQYQEADGAPPAAALVTQVNRDQHGKVANVGLSVIHPGYMGLTCLEGVRHKSWPSKEQIRSSGVGVWDYCPADPLTYLMHTGFEGLSAGYEQLRKAHNELQERFDKFEQLTGVKICGLGGLDKRLSDLELLTAPKAAPGPAKAKEHAKSAA